MYLTRDYCCDIYSVTSLTYFIDLIDKLELICGSYDLETISGSQLNGTSLGENCFLLLLMDQLVG